MPLYVDRARTVLDFFVNHCQLPNGFSHGIFDPLNDRFTHWFTGILMPFQYAEDETEVRRYVGRQIADALTPIARELRGQEGNYLRTMCESVYPLLLAYQRTGAVHPHWLEAGRRFGSFLLETQAEDGSWFRAYAPDGTGLTSPGGLVRRRLPGAEERDHLPDPGARAAAPDHRRRPVPGRPPPERPTSSATPSSTRWPTWAG